MKDDFYQVYILKKLRGAQCEPLLNYQLIICWLLPTYSELAYSFECAIVDVQDIVA